MTRSFGIRADLVFHAFCFFSFSPSALKEWWEFAIVMDFQIYTSAKNLRIWILVNFMSRSEVKCAWQFKIIVMYATKKHFSVY